MGEKTVIEWSDRARRAKGLGPAADEVKAVRQLWEKVANQALERAGYQERIDSRSLKARGIEREATIHLGPAASEMERRGIPSDRGDMNRQAAANNQERVQLVAEVIDLKEQRQHREVAQKAARRERDAIRRQEARQAHERLLRERFDETARKFEQASKPWQEAPQQPAQAPCQSRPSEPAPAARWQPSPDELQAQREQTERERIERLSSDELSREIERLRPQDVAVLVLEDEAVKAAREAQQALEEQIHSSRQLEIWARDTAGMWRQSHPLKARAHDAGLFRSEFLTEREGVEAEAYRRRVEAQNSLPDAKQKAENARQAAEKRILVEQAPRRRRMTELQKVLDAKQERARVARDFQALAEKRAAPMLGWGDGGKQWQATPALLRERIELYNRAPPDVQAVLLQRLGADPQASQQFKALLEQRQEQVRQLARGRSR